MNLPISSKSAELDLRALEQDYTAMSISPLAYMPYTPHGNATPIGYAGVASGPDGAIAVSRLAHYDPATSLDMMRGWLTPAVRICLPESSDYPEEILDAVVARSGDSRPLALFLLEDEGGGDKRISLAALKSLGKTSIEEKAAVGLRPSTDEVRGIQRFMRKSKLDARAAFGKENYEALVVGGALTLKLFDASGRQITARNQRAIDS